MEELQAIDVRQHMVCSKGSAMEKHCREHQFPMSAFPRKSSFSWSFARQLARIQKSFQPTVVHVHGSHAHTFAVMAATLFGCRAPIVVSRRVDFPISNSLLSKYKYNHHQVAKIICVSDAIREITARGLKNPEILTTVHSGIDLSRFQPEQKGTTLRETYHVPQEHALIGNVAALAPHKDYFTFVDTVELLVAENLPATFFIIGTGPMEEEVRSYVKSKGLENAILFTGFRKDIPQILPELDVFLISSETEGLGTSILDALACKVPVVATNAGGIPEIILHQKTGWLGKVKNPKSLAEGVKTLLHDAGLRQQLVDGGWQHLKQFDKATTARKTLEIYQRVIGESG